MITIFTDISQSTDRKYTDLHICINERSIVISYSWFARIQAMAIYPCVIAEDQPIIETYRPNLWKCKRNTKLSQSSNPVRQSSPVIQSSDYKQPNARLAFRNFAQTTTAIFPLLQLFRAQILYTSVPRSIKYFNQNAPGVKKGPRTQKGLDEKDVQSNWAAKASCY